MGKGKRRMSVWGYLFKSMLPFFLALWFNDIIGMIRRRGLIRRESAVGDWVLGNKMVDWGKMPEERGALYIDQCFEKIA